MSDGDEEDTLECWGWTDLSRWAVLDEERADRPDSPSPRSPPTTMSRRSLRIHTPHEHGSPYGSASFSLPARREPTSSKSSRHPQLSVSCSQSLLQTPRRHSLRHNHHSSLHSPASDASLLSSMLDESSIQERTVVDRFWGLDDDVEPQESTIISEHSTALANSTLIAAVDDDCRHGHPAQTQTSMVNGYPGKDCFLPPDNKEAPAILRGSSKFPHPNSGPAGVPVASAALYSGARNRGLSAGSEDGAFPASTIYCRDKSRKGKPGVFLSVWDSVRSVCRRTAASLALLLTLIYKHMLIKKHLDHEGVLNWILAVSREATASTVSILNLASSGSRGSMDSDGPGDQNQNSSLWAYVWQLAQRAGSAGWVVTQKCVSDLRASGPSAGQVGSSVLHWLGRGWCHTVSFMALLKDLLLVRWLPNLFRIALLLLLVLLLSVLLGWWDPREVLSSALAVDGTDWWDALPLASIPGLAAVLKPPQETGSLPSLPEQSTDLPAYAEPPRLPPPPVQEEEEASPGDSERLQRLEQSMSQLWEHVEQQQQQLAARAQSEPDRALEPWLDGLLEDKLAEMRVRLEEDRVHREQTRKQHMAQQESHASRLTELELLLRALTAKMEQVQQRQEAVTTTTTTTLQPTSVGGVDHTAHGALRSDVSRLEAALGGVRRDLKGLRGCRGHCDRMDHMQETVGEEIFSRVRAQVREELRVLLYGNPLVSLSQTDDDDDRAALPDSLLQWLAERYISGADLRASLASLELGILRNVSRQLERRRQEPADDDDGGHHRTSVTQAVAGSLEAAGAGVTEEQVQLIVRNALRLYSQDRTGLVDYALESGGGSILSTRCSETYRTRAALLSLFGVPLWYFSQSPRVVIQPDVHPGNCWAFRGSTGYLVIRLSMKVLPTAFSLEHIPKALAPSGALRSAPRDFTVYGLEDEGQVDGKLLGSYSYDEDGEALQTYDVTEENEQAFQIIEVRILSNWGSQEYTCMYRLRVHGRPSYT